MRVQQIKFRSLSNNYSIIIGNNILGFSKRIKLLCPKTKKIAIIVDKKVSPKKFK